MLFSFAWSEQSGVSLSTESAQARVGRPLTPVSVAGVARRTNRRAAYGYGAGAVGAGLAAGAVGAATVAAATSPWGYYNTPYGYGANYGYNNAAYYGYAGDPNAAYAAAPGWNAGYAKSPWGSYHCNYPHAYDCLPYDQSWQW